LALLQTRGWAREVLDFHKRETTVQFRTRSIHINERREKPQLARVSRKVHSVAAPFSGTGLWTGCTRLKKQIVTTASFRLTEKIEGVQQDRSLTAS
jgi:hypothetical protein